MKKDLDRSKASFKLDLLETANADPTVSPADFKVLAAYASVLEWPSCRTWLAASLARAMTGLSERQFRTSRGRLLGKNDAKRAYLTPARRGGKVAAYKLVNPWRDEALEHVAAMTGYHKEVERQKKAIIRADLSRQNLQGQEPTCPGKICRSVPAEFAAYTPSVIPPKKKGGHIEQPKAGTVVLLSDHRRKA